MSAPLYQVDAFTSVPYTGNPAAVCLLPAPAEASWMSQVAREMNLSETAFVSREEDELRLRWFTPAVEVDLCGHATLAAAHVLWEAGWLALDQPARFRTLSGGLGARRVAGGIELDFPAEPPRPDRVPPAVLEALGAKPLWTGRNRLDYVVEVESPGELAAVAPDFRRLAAATGESRGVIVTSRSESPEFDFLSRYFAPGVGIDEDPVTGSAHCCLGPFWAARLGKNDLSARQASARGGSMRVRLEGERVALTGQAVTVLRGELL